MRRNKSPKTLNNQYFNLNQGFGLVDAIVSITLLTGVITYGVYFSSVRLNTAFRSNLTTSINKEIERDIERLKSDFWGLYFDEDECSGGYCYSEDKDKPIPCSDFGPQILSLESWNIEDKSIDREIQSWKPGAQNSKVFSGEPVTITRELTMKFPLDNELLNKTIASISYIVKWSDNNIHWLSFLLSPEAHSWCENEM